MYRYDLVKEEETIIEDYWFDEKDYNLYPVFAKCYGDKFIIYSDDNNIHRTVHDTFEKAEKMAEAMYADQDSASIIVDVN